MSSQGGGDGQFDDNRGFDTDGDYLMKNNGESTLLMKIDGDESWWYWMEIGITLFVSCGVKIDDADVEY